MENTNRSSKKYVIINLLLMLMTLIIALAALTLVAISA